MGQPVAFPSNTPERSSTLSASFRGVVMRLCPRLPAVELVLDEIHVDVQPRGASVYDPSYARAMALAERGQAENVPKSVTHII